MDWKKAIAGVAPTIARAIGGPVGGIAIDALAKALKLDTSDPAALEKKVASLTAGDLIAIKAADNQFARDMKALDIDLEKVDAADRADARKREVETHDWTPRVLAFLTISAFIAVIWYVLSGRATNIKEAAAIGLTGTVIGYASAKADMVLGYYFGSSVSSRSKDATIRGLTDGKK